jgi:membrane-associated phospholipid phosphatase
MFQTTINHFFQGFAGSFSNWFMNLMSDFGSYPVYLTIIFIVMFGWDLKKGFFLAHIMIWTGMSNSYLKDYFNLPRPLDIDESLKTLGPDYNHIKLNAANRGANGFFQALPHEIIEKCRSLGLKSPGFPSGHAASATSFWMSLSIMAERTWLWILGVVIILLVMISRMYLGVHFLADISSGFACGLLIIAIGFFIYYKILEIDIHGQKHFYLYTFIGRTMKFLYYVGFPIGLSFIPQIGIHYTGPLLGINLAIITSDLVNIEERGQIWERVIRVLFAIIVFFGIAKLISYVPIPKTELVKFILVSAHYFISLRLSIAICVWTKLYKRSY